MISIVFLELKDLSMSMNLVWVSKMSGLSTTRRILEECESAHSAISSMMVIVVLAILRYLY